MDKAVKSGTSVSKESFIFINSSIVLLSSFLVISSKLTLFMLSRFVIMSFNKLFFEVSFAKIPAISGVSSLIRFIIRVSVSSSSLAPLLGSVA